MDDTTWKAAATAIGAAAGLVASVFAARWLAHRASGSSVVRQVLTMVLSTAIFLLFFAAAYG